MNKKEIDETKKKLTTPLTARNSNNPRKKTFVHIIPKDSNNNQQIKIPSLSEIIVILKKPRPERTFSDINKLNSFLTAKYDYFRNMRNKNDAYQYSRTLSVLKYIEVQRGNNIVTFDEEGDKCYVLLEGEISILKPIYSEKKMTMKTYVDYLKFCDLKDPSTITRKRIIEKNNHISIDVEELFILPPDSIDENEIYNIFTESFEKVFEAKDGFTFGETALLHKQRRNATIRAEKFCKLIYIDKFDYNRIMKESEKKRIDEEMQVFVDKFYIFKKWGYINMYKLYSLITDIKLYKNDVLYRQNDYNEYIYFCIEGTLEKYTQLSFKWKNQFVDYISNFNSNFFLRVNAIKYLSYSKLMKMISEAKKAVPESPMIFKDCYFENYNASNYQQKDINELIENKDEKFLDPYDIFKVTLNNIKNNEIIGLEEIVEFKNRFSTIIVKSEFAHLKRIKAIDFLKLYICNTSYERNDDYVLDYIIEKKISLINQIELLSKYKKKKFINNYIEEYNKCYNNININRKNLNNKMEHYINSLSKSKKKLNLSKNMLLKKMTKFQNFLGFNSPDKSNNIENQKNNINEPPNLNTNSHINFNLQYKLSPSNICLHKSHSKKSENIFKIEFPKSKFSSFFPSTKNETIKLRDDTSFPNNNNINKSLSILNYKLNLPKSTKNFININEQRKFVSASYDKVFKENDMTKREIYSRNIKLKKNFRFNLGEYKKNLFCKYGFLINEIIKLGIGPNIPLRKEMTILNNNINTGKKLNSNDTLKNNKKSIFLETEIRKKTNEFLKITEL